MSIFACCIKHLTHAHVQTPVRDRLVQNMAPTVARQKSTLLLSVLSHICNLSYWEGEAGGIQVLKPARICRRDIVSNPKSKKKKKSIW